MKIQGQRYAEIATSKSHIIAFLKSFFHFWIDNFQPEIQPEAAGQYLEDMRNQNQLIEQVINQQREQNPQMEEILSKLVEWQWAKYLL